MTIDTVLNAFDFNTPVNTCTQAEYDRLQQEGKLKEGDIYCIVDDNSIGIASSSYPRFVATGTDGIYYDYTNKEYQQDGIEIDNITNTEAIYKAIFESLCKNNPEKREDWALLLKLNEYNYTLTVTQIQTKLLEQNE